jgi:hypothetical protein
VGDAVVLHRHEGEHRQRQRQQSAHHGDAAPLVAQPRQNAVVCGLRFKGWSPVIRDLTVASSRFRPRE